MKLLFFIAVILVIIGSINWGLIGFFNKNLVTEIFGEDNLLTKIIYCLVGIAGIYLPIFLIVTNFKATIMD